MTDPTYTRQAVKAVARAVPPRRQDDDSPEEAERRRQKRALESQARHGQAPDPVHVLRAHLTDEAPGVHRYAVARWSLVARLVSDAAEAGADEVTDRGPLPLDISSPGVLVWVGVRRGGQWVSITEGCERIAEAITDMERGLS